MLLWCCSSLPSSGDVCSVAVLAQWPHPWPCRPVPQVCVCVHMHTCFHYSMYRLRTQIKPVKDEKHVEKVQLCPSIYRIASLTRMAMTEQSQYSRLKTTPGCPGNQPVKASFSASTSQGPLRAQPDEPVDASLRLH